MKSLLAGVALALGAALTGCVSRGPVPPSDSRVTVSPDVAYDVYVTDVRCTKGKSDFLTLQANAVSLCSKPLGVEWKTVWLDADGIEIESVVSTWDALVLQPHEIRGLKSTAPRDSAADMRIYIRKAK